MTAPVYYQTPYLSLSFPHLNAHTRTHMNPTQVWYCQQQGIAITGFSPLGASSYIQLGMDQGEGVGVLKCVGD